MDYNFREIERKWQAKWREENTYVVKEDSTKEKFYVLDMFPYPSGAGLHVGHPLGYIASDIFSRFKRLKGFNVLHPMGYDSFGLPAEQYAIQTGQHPAITTENNIARYREQLDKIGFSYDWSREVRTSDPSYYKWTQWIFKQLFNSWYDLDEDKAKDISSLIKIFETEGNTKVKAENSSETTFTAEEWSASSEKEKEDLLQDYRLTYLSDTMVNWCEELGTVLANDEVKDGLSERGGYPVVQKKMRQWSMRISAYAQRLLDGLDKIDFSDSLKEQQRNWIGRSEGASVFFSIDGHDEKIEVFTTRPDTIFGVSFMVLAPEHEWVAMITTNDQKEEVEAYQKAAASKSERDRMSNVKEISGAFTGAYAIHPFSGEKIPIWIGDYVLAGYGTGAVMAVPAGDQRDFDFANHFSIPIPKIFAGYEDQTEAIAEKDVTFANSDFLNGLGYEEASKKIIEEIEKRELGAGKVNFRLRDAIFSRQRYWGEPFPIYFENDIPKVMEDGQLPLTLPKVDKYLPTESGEPPLARAKKQDWPQFYGDRMETNTMPGWAGSSWYYLRYMDPKNDTEFVSKERSEYWKEVDLYIGGAEHAVGHLLYSRFWCKFLFDREFISFDEPFKKLINQGMILGKSAIAYIRVNDGKLYSFDLINKDENKGQEYRPVKIWIDLLNDDESIKIDELRKWQPQFESIELVENADGKVLVKREVDKMSKRWFNVVNPDELCEEYGADTLRCYEMFLGPLEQAKPWDTKGINGVHNFLRKFWNLSHTNGELSVSDGEPNKAALKSLHKTINKIEEDLNRYSFNTVVSALMICVNELNDQKCNNRQIIEELCVLISPYAPHIAEELWEELGHKDSILNAQFPVFEASHLVENEISYPVSFNGKMRFKLEVARETSKEDVEKLALEDERAQKWLDGVTVRKVIVVPGKIVNVVIG